MAAESASAVLMARVVGASLSLRFPRVLVAPPFLFPFIVDPWLRIIFCRDDPVAAAAAMRYSGIVVTPF